MSFDALRRSMCRRPLGSKVRAAAILFVLALLIGTGPAAAHDMWILPSHFAPPAGTPVEVRLRVGHGGKADVVYRQPQRIVRFAALGPDGETALLGLPGQDPAGYLRPAVDGLYTLVYESNTARSELDGPAFTRYLHEEGLDSVLAARATRGEEDQPGRERYARALKSLVVVGEAAAAWDRPRGLALELVLEGDPNHVPANGELAFQLLYHGAPLAGALVGCQPVGAAEEATARSDGEGRVRFPVVAGTWMVSAVHMVPKSVDDADWMSVWTSLTFQLSPAPPSGETR